MANSLGQDIPEGTVVVLKGGKNGFSGSQEDRRFVCQGGFGLCNETIGRAVFGYFVHDRAMRRVSIDGYDLLKIAKDQTVPKVETV